MDIAISYSKINYDNTNWRKLYDSLQALFQLEYNLRNSEIIADNDIDELKDKMFESMDAAEESLNQEGKSNPVASETTESLQVNKQFSDVILQDHIERKQEAMKG